MHLLVSFLRIRLLAGALSSIDVDCLFVAPVGNEILDDTVGTTHADNAYYDGSEVIRSGVSVGNASRLHSPRHWDSLELRGHMWHQAHLIDPPPGAQHLGFAPHTAVYEMRKESTAAIGPGEASRYFYSGFFGGRRRKVYEMLLFIARNRSLSLHSAQFFSLLCASAALALSAALVLTQVSIFKTVADPPSDTRTVSGSKTRRDSKAVDLNPRQLIPQRAYLSLPPWLPDCARMLPTRTARRTWRGEWWHGCMTRATSTVTGHKFSKVFSVVTSYTRCTRALTVKSFCKASAPPARILTAAYMYPEVLARRMPPSLPPSSPVPVLHLLRPHPISTPVVYISALFLFCFTNTWVGEEWAYISFNIYVSHVKFFTSKIKKCVMGLRSPGFFFEIFLVCL